MAKEGKTISTYLVVLFVFLLVLLAMIAFFLLYNINLFQKENKRYKGTDEEVIQYVKDTHDVDVEILSNNGPKNMNNTGGATVQTKDERELKFKIEISIFNNIKSDTYEEESSVYSLNEALQSSEEPRALANIGADSVEIQLPDTSTPWHGDYNPFFTLIYPETLGYQVKKQSKS